MVTEKSLYLSNTKEWPFWAVFLIILMGSLVNLVAAPQMPIIPLLSLLVLLLITSLVYRKMLLFLILFSILTSESLYFEVGPLVIRGFDVVLIFALLQFSIKWLIEPKSSFESLPIFKVAFSLLIFTALISLINTLSLKNSLFEIIQIMELIIAAYLFFNLIKDERDIKFLLVALLSYSVLDALWILFQYLTVPDMHGRHIGMFQTLAFELSYGTAIATAFFFTAKKDSQKLAMLLCAGLQIAAIYISKGRGLLITAILMAMICNLLFAVSQKSLKAFTYGSVGILTALIFFYITLDQEFQSRYASIVEGGEMRDLRLVIWALSLKIWQSFPLFGVGVGNAEIALAQFAPKPFGIALTALADVKTPHNEYLSFAVQAGFFGFFSGLFFYAILLRNSILIYRKSKERLKEYSIILLAFITGLLVLNMANDSLLVGKGILIMLFIAILSRIYSLDYN